jgi:hypothetical protein
MAVRRTKKDKIQTQIRREQTVSYSFDSVDTVSQAQKPVKKLTKNTNQLDQSLLLNDPALIVKDLQKTVLVSTIIVGLLLASYGWLR